jgi:hypothetical protein
MQGDRGRHCQGNPFVGGSEQVVHGIAEGRIDGARIELAEFLDLRGLNIGAGVDEIGSLAPAFGREVAETQGAGRQHELDELVLEVFH